MWEITELAKNLLALKKGCAAWRE